MKETMKNFWNNIIWDAKTIGLAAGLISQLAFVLMAVFTKIDFLAFLMMGFWLIGIVVAGVLLGKYIFRGVFGWCKKLFVAGWLIVPFPMDIFTGIACSGLAIGLGCFAIFFLPGVLAVSAYTQAKKEGK